MRRTAVGLFHVSYAAVMGIVALGLSGIQPAQAAGWNEETLITFDAPVEIQGKALPAGTYLFRLSGASYVRDVVEVWSPDRTHSFGTFMTSPIYSLEPAGRTFVTLQETPTGSPEALKVWFHRGEHYGREFAPPKSNFPTEKRFAPRRPAPDSATSPEP